MDVGTLRESLNRVDFNRIMVESLKEFEVFLLDANTDQLLHGKRSTGEMIGKYANSDYAAMKYAENSLAGFGNIDLILTGEFKRGINIKFTDRSMIFDSTGKEKEGGADLLYEYGDDVLGVSDENIRKLRSDFMQIFNKNYKKAIGV